MNTARNRINMSIILLSIVLINLAPTLGYPVSHPTSNFLPLDALKCLPQEPELLLDIPYESSKHFTGLIQSNEHKLRNSAEGERRLRELIDSVDLDEIPDDFDYSNDSSRVTRVAKQYCNNCWAYATAAVLEGQQARIGYLWNSQAIPLSTQMLTDCVLGTGKCRGDYTTTALRYVNETGIETVCTRPSKKNDELGSCDMVDHKNRMMRGRISEIVYKVLGHGLNGSDLKRLLIAYGPVIASVNSDWLSKDKSIKFPKGSANNLTNHAVTLVGFGVNEFEEEYFIVKNSWGISWGNKGYGYLHLENMSDELRFSPKIILPIVD